MANEVVHRWWEFRPSAPLIKHLLCGFTVSVKILNVLKVKSDYFGESLKIIGVVSRYKALGIEKISKFISDGHVEGMQRDVTPLTDQLIWCERHNNKKIHSLRRVPTNPSVKSSAKESKNYISPLTPFNKLQHPDWSHLFIHDYYIWLLCLRNYILKSTWHLFLKGKYLCMDCNYLLMLPYTNWSFPTNISKTHSPYYLIAVVILPLQQITPRTRYNRRLFL